MSGKLRVGKVARSGKVSLENDGLENDGLETCSREKDLAPEQDQISKGELVDTQTLNIVINKGSH